MIPRGVAAGGAVALVVLLSPEVRLPGFDARTAILIERELPRLSAWIGRALAAVPESARVAALALIAALALLLVIRALPLGRAAEHRRVLRLARRGLGRAGIARRTGLAQDAVRDVLDRGRAPAIPSRQGLPAGNRLRPGRRRPRLAEAA